MRAQRQHMSKVRTRWRTQFRNGNFQQPNNLRRLPQTSTVMIVFIKAINRQTAVNTMQNILTC